MIHITDLTKSYKDRRILSNIDLNVREGEVHGLLGVSGVGKSTLLRCINGLEGYDSGQLIVNGVDINKLKKKEFLKFRKNIGMIFQNFAILERKTVFENVALPMECWHYPKDEIKSKVTELLELVGITEKESSYPKELSGGQKQRVAIARALSLDPTILLCDEATSALDPATTKSVLNLLNVINQKTGITMVVVTHEMSVARALCDNISILENGKIGVSDTAENIFLYEPDALYNLKGEFEDPDIKRTGIKLSLNDIQLQEPVLNDISINLNVKYSVLEAHIDQCKNKKIGHFILESDYEDAVKIQEYCKNKHIICNLMNKDGVL